MICKYVVTIQEKTESTTKESFQKSVPKQMIQLLESFNTMCRPHEAREDMVLFPALRKIVSRNEFYALGEDFEKRSTNCLVRTALKV